MRNVTAQVVYDPSRTRACLKTEEGEFVCSEMEMTPIDGTPDEITLTPVGKTRDGSKARRWIAMGIAP